MERKNIMRKVLSLLLIVLMISFTIMLTSCDVAKIVLSVLDLFKEDNTDIDININLGGINTNQHTHTVYVIVGTEATCSSTGLTEGRTCLECEKVLVPQVEIPMKAHIEVIDEAVEATCTSTGLT